MGNVFSKIAIVGMVIFSTCMKTNGQGRELHVTHSTQLNGTWCWVASMEMIMKFHNTEAAPSQSDIFKKYAKEIKRWNDSITCTSCNTSYKVMVKNRNSISCTSLFSIPFSRQSTIDVDYLDMIFHGYGFQSSQEINKDNSPISWLCLKKQIDECRPFIAFVDLSNVNGNLSNHAIVVKGYQTQGGTQYLIANDPFVQCGNTDTVTTFFPYANFLDIPGNSLTGTSIDKVLAIVGNIRKDTLYTNLPDDNCKSCNLVSTAMGRQCFTDLGTGPTSSVGTNGRTGIGGAGFMNIQDSIKEEPKGDPFVALILNNKDRVAGYTENLLDSVKLSIFLRQKKYFGSKVKYLSLERLAKCFIFHGSNKISETLEHEEEVIDLVSGGVDKNLVSTFQKNKEGLWVLRKITNHTSLKSRIDLKPSSSSSSSNSFVLSNSMGEDSIRGSINYELIKFPLLQYEFYSFRANGKSYMSPAEKYPGLEIELGVAYDEKKVIGAMRKVANNLLSEYRIGLKTDVKAQLNNLKQVSNFGKTTTSIKSIY